MTKALGQPASRLAIGLAGVGLATAWLWFGPVLVADIVAPGGAGAEALFTVLVFVPLLLLALAGGAFTGIQVWTLGPRPGFAAIRGVGFGIGALLLAIAFAALAGTLQRGAGGGVISSLILGLAVVVLQAGIEELLFRGWLQRLAAQQFGTAAAVVLIAGCFALLHVLNSGFDLVLLHNLFFGGLLFGLLAARDGGIAGAVAAHASYNAGEQLLFGLDPNPGVGGFGAFIDLDLTGALRWGGSEGGLNASWAMTFALAALVAPLILRWRGTKAARA